ncbi:MAG: aspartate/glutamate racemase family protein, partial [Rhodospirillales bacterium]|nr:aspartate/glutamate racemase family protein [Rhodospirillales bacterium]
DSFHVVDESLIQDARRHGGLVPGIVRRIATQVGLAQEAGAEVILFTCSSTSPAVDAVRPLADVPIVKIDDAMAVRAIETGSRIGLLCTSKTTVGPSERLIQDHAATRGRAVTLTTVVENDAYFALRNGDKAGHDAAVAAAAGRLAGSVDVIVLAQASMAHLAAQLGADLPIPVLDSPSLCVEGLAPYLTG